MRAVALFAAVLFSAQATPPPPAQTSGLTPSMIVGTVTNEAGRPVAGAFVVVFPADAEKWTAPVIQTIARLAAIEAGRFSVEGLPSGAYRIGVVGEASSKMFPRQPLFARLSSMSIPLTLSAQRVGIDLIVAATGDDFRVTTAQMTGGPTVEVIRGGLRPGLPTPPPGRGGPPTGPPQPTAPGSISGRIVDASDRPLAGIEVRAMRRVNLNGVLQLATFGQLVATDADGRYRLANRQAGEYFVVAIPHVIERTTPPIGISIQKSPPAENGPDGRALGYVMTFFPGAVAEREAATVTVETDERAGIDFRLLRRPVFPVSGQVEGFMRAAGQASLSIAPSRIAEQMGGVNVRRVLLAPDGKFEIPEVPDGDYAVSVRTSGGWAESAITIAGSAPQPLKLPLTPDRVVTGRVEFVGRTAAPVIEPARMGPPAFSAELRPVAISAGTSFSVVPVLPDGTFTARGSGPGPLALRARTVAPWMQVAGLIDGIDTLDLPYAGMAGASNAVIILADRMSSVLVSVRSELDRPETDATVILFSEDNRYWSARSRRVQVAALTPAGTVTLNDVPPGKYFVLAGRDFGPGRVINAAFIENIKARALPIEILPGESRAVNIRVN